MEPFDQSTTTFDNMRTSVVALGMATHLAVEQDSVEELIEVQLDTGAEVH